MVGEVVDLLLPELLGVLADELRGRHFLVDSRPLVTLEDVLLLVGLVVPLSM